MAQISRAAAVALRDLHARLSPAGRGTRFSLLGGGRRFPALPSVRLPSVLRASSTSAGEQEVNRLLLAAERQDSILKEMEEMLQRIKKEKESTSLLWAESAGIVEKVLARERANRANADLLAVAGPVLTVVVQIFGFWLNSDGTEDNGELEKLVRSVVLGYEMDLSDEEDADPSDNCGPVNGDKAGNNNAASSTANGDKGGHSAAVTATTAATDSSAAAAATAATHSRAAATTTVTDSSAAAATTAAASGTTVKGVPAAGEKTTV